MTDIVGGYYRARGDLLICGAANSIAVRFLNSEVSDWDAAGCTPGSDSRRMSRILGSRVGTKKIQILEGKL